VPPEVLITKLQAAAEAVSGNTEGLLTTAEVSNVLKEVEAPL